MSDIKTTVIFYPGKSKVNDFNGAAKRPTGVRILFLNELIN